MITAVIIDEGLTATLRHGDGQEGGDLWRIEIIQSGVNVPAVKAGMGEVLLGGDRRLVEGAVVRVLEGEV